MISILLLFMPVKFVVSVNNIKLKSLHTHIASIYVMSLNQAYAMYMYVWLILNIREGRLLGKWPHKNHVNLKNQIK